MNPRFRVLLQSAILASAVLVAAAALAGAFRLLSPAPGRTSVIWSATGGGPPPGDFRVLAFPTGGMGVRASPGGEPMRTLERALLNSLEESDGWIPVREAGEIGWVRADELTHMLPPEGVSSPLVEKLKAAVAARSPGFTLEASEPRPGVVTVTLAEPDETRRWTYAIDGATTRPMAYEYANRMTAAKEENSAITAALLAGLIAGAVTYFLLRRFLWRSFTPVPSDRSPR